MIPSLRPATTLPLLLAALLLPGSRATLRAADDDAAPRRAAAAELLVSMRMEQAVGGASKRMITNMDTMADRLSKQPGLTPQQTTDIQKFREEIHTLIEQQLGWEQIKPDVVQAYADEFTEGELKELNTFYHTPTGQKYLEKQQGLSIKLNQVMQQKSTAVAPAIRQKIQAINQEVRPMPASAPVRGPIAIPGTSPATTVVVPAAPPSPVPPTVTTTTAPVPMPTATAPAPAAPTASPAP